MCADLGVTALWLAAVWDAVRIVSRCWLWLLSDNTRIRLKRSSLATGFKLLQNRAPEL
jgi:hypothetical protein